MFLTAATSYAMLAADPDRPIGRGRIHQQDIHFVRRPPDSFSAYCQIGIRKLRHRQILDGARAQVKFQLCFVIEDFYLFVTHISSLYSILVF
jgi:hypothetical protein